MSGRPGTACVAASLARVRASVTHRYGWHFVSVPAGLLVLALALGSHSPLASAATVDIKCTLCETITTTVLSPSSNPVLVGQSVTLEAKVSPVPDGGTVEFAASGSPVTGCEAVAVNTGNGTASCTTTFFMAGAESVTAVYSGNGGYSSSSGSLSGLSVDAASTLTVLSSPASAVVGQPVTYVATVGAVAPSSGVPGGGTVEFVGVPGCAAVVLNTGNGTASCTTTFSMAGAESVTAVYSGDGGYLSSSRSGSGLTVDAASTLTVLSSPASAVVGQPVTYVATVGAVAPSSGVPGGGTVEFVGGSGTLPGCAAVALNTSTGTASCTTMYATSAGSPYTVDASYSGNHDYLASASSILSETITESPTPTSALPAASKPAVVDQGATPTASVTIAAQRAIVAANGALSVELTCSGAPCGGSLTLRSTVEKTTGRGKHKKTKRSAVTIGAAAFSASGLGSESVSLTLNASGLRLLEQGHYKLAGTAVVTYTSGSVSRTASAAVSLNGTKPKRKATK